MSAIKGVVSRSTWPTRDLWTAELLTEDDSEKAKVEE
jgi:hypothetical protein